VSKDLLLVILIAVMLALAVPFSTNAFQTEQAFTRDNLIFIHTAANASGF
jgi:hypothetical protein